MQDKAATPRTSPHYGGEGVPREGRVICFTNFIVNGGCRGRYKMSSSDFTNWCFELIFSVYFPDKYLTDNICQDSIQTPYKSRNIKKITYLSQKMGYFSENIRLLTKNLSQKVEYDEVEYIYALLFQQCPFSNSQEIV